MILTVLALYCEFTLSSLHMASSEMALILCLLDPEGENQNVRRCRRITYGEEAREVEANLWRIGGP